MQFIVFPILFAIVLQLDRRFQQDSDMINRGIGKQRVQSFLANDTFTQARMRIAVAAQSHFCIIQVDDVQVRYPYDGIEMVEHLSCGSRAGDIMSSAPQMSSVETYS